MCDDASCACRRLVETLSRTIGASGTPTSALVPWDSCGAYMAATLGVATLSYAPYAIFNFASPLLTIAFACLGLRLLREPSAVPAGDESRRS